MEHSPLQDIIPNLLTRSVEVNICSPTNGDSWWEQTFNTPPTTTTSPEYQLAIPSSYNFTESSIQSTTSPSSIYTSAYPWPEERYTPYTACNGVQVSSQSSYPSSQVTVMSGRGFNMSPQAVYSSPLPHMSPQAAYSGPPSHMSPQAVYSSPPPHTSPQAAYSSPPPYPYSSFCNGVPATVQNNFYPSGDSSPIESPVSSPESLDFFTNEKSKLTALPRADQVCLPPPFTSKYSIASSFSSYPVTSQAVQIDSRMTNKQVRMPQRKGGIQLWQFLYALLSNKTHSNLMEWTSNRACNEFRMLEPESIAVWWGTIKSKPTMTYDKFSRSLRYYYHKGILKKIQGERYMYRFLVDPEDMYRHIGTSDKRTELKTMPKEAKLVMGIFSKQRVDMAIERSPIVTKPPEGLPVSSSPPKTLIKTEVKSLKVNNLDFNNSNNSFADFSNLRLPLTQSSRLPLLIPAVAW